MTNLTEIYLQGRDIKDSEIPEIWRESFNHFITGQTCVVERGEDGEITDFIYYACDFKLWYQMNQTVIERDLKIDQLTKQK